MSDGKGVILAVGDVAPDRDNPDECFDLIREPLSQADFVFCQLETSLAEKGARMPQARHAVLTKPAVAQAMRRANFGVISCAGNHCLDWGAEALFETIANLQSQGMNVVGAGANIREARRPVVRTVAKTRVAFLAYSSILPASYWAEELRAGCAPMRAHTLYEQIELDQPGTPCRIHTYAHTEDLEALRHDVRAARSVADVVIVSMHWGIHFIPAALADYQREVGHAAIDAGADLILGHHAHILKGVEIYQGRPIFYSLGNFATDLRMDMEHAQRKSFREIQALSPGWEPDFEGLYNFPQDSKKTLVIRIEIRDGALREVSLLPAYINRQAQARLLDPDEAEFNEVTAYLEQISNTADLNTIFERCGRRLLVRSDSAALANNQ